MQVGNEEDAAPERHPLGRTDRSTRCRPPPAPGQAFCRTPRSIPIGSCGVRREGGWGAGVPGPSPGQPRSWTGGGRGPAPLPGGIGALPGLKGFPPPTSFALPGPTPAFPTLEALPQRVFLRTLRLRILLSIGRRRRPGRRLSRFRKAPLPLPFPLPFAT